MKKELKMSKKDVEMLSEQNKNMEIELESRQKIDNAIDYLRQSNQKVTNRCAELESQLSTKKAEATGLDQQLKSSET